MKTVKNNIIFDMDKNQKLSKKNTKKLFCEGSVQMLTINKINKEILDNKDVYCLKIDNKDCYFKQCSLTAKKDSKLCFKHDQHKNNCVIFDTILKNSNSIKISTILNINKSKINPIISFIITKELKEQFLKISFDSNIIIDNNKIKDNEIKNNQQSEINQKSNNNIINDINNAKDQDKNQNNDINSINNVKDQDKNLNQNNDTENDTENEESDQEIIEAEEILTKNGKTFYLADKYIYDKDSEDNSSQIGELLAVNDSNSPIIHNGENCIIAMRDIEENGIKYIRCVYTNKLYIQKGNIYNKIGTIEMMKNKKYKIKLDKN